MMSKLPLNLSLTFILLLIIGTAVLAQEKYVLSGYVKEEKTGETLIGAAVAVVEQPGLGTVTNTYGYCSIELNEGAHTLQFSYVGYDAQTVEVNLTASKRLNINLTETSIDLKEVVIRARPDDANVKSTEMGTVGLQMTKVKKLPALMGEVDVLKTILLLQGVL